jgi:hypothetical protein
MFFRSSLLIALSSVFLGSTAAFADLVTVTSYDMNNGNGASQFTTPTGGQNYFDFTYTQTGQSSPTANAGINGSASSIPTNSNATNAPLTGGTGMLTDGVIAGVNYSLVSSSNGTIPTNPVETAFGLSGKPTEYVGWKYQDPTVTFHLAGGHSVSQISLYVAASNSGGLVGTPGNVALSLNGSLLSSSLYTEVTSNYLQPGNPYAANTDLITLTLKQPVSSTDLFSLQLFRGPLGADGYAYESQYWDPINHVFNDPASGFQGSAWDPKLEPWIMLSEVQFTAAVPELSTWIMMVLGFAGLGFMTYRKRQTAVATD